MKAKLLGRLAAAAVLLLSATTATAHDFDVDGIYYNKNSDGTASVTYKGNDIYAYDNEYSGTVTIPSEVTYEGETYSVTSIGIYAFSECRGLTSVEIPNSVTSIGGGAFSECRGLTSVEIPNSVTSIGGGAFRDTPFYDNQPDGEIYFSNVFYEYKGIMPSETSISIKEGTVAISPIAFEGCSGLTSVVIPNSVTTIGERAFYDCSGLTAVEIPSSVTSIGDEAFLACGSLESITVESGNTSYDSRDNCNALIETATNTLLCGCKNTIIPNSVTAIGDSSFCECYGLTSVVIPNSVTAIGVEAFYGCYGLTSIVIPNSVTEIGEDAFAFCEGLASLSLGNSLTTIREGAFYGCSMLTAVEIPSSVTLIEEDAFANCANLETMTVESGNKRYDSRDNCNAIIETNFNRLVSGCKKTVIPQSVTAIGSWSFYGCAGLSTIEIPNTITEIGEGAFMDCSELKSIKIPNLVTKISDQMFQSCVSLESVELPNSITEIGQQAFEECYSLKSVTSLNTTPPAVEFYAFKDVPSDCVLYVPDGSIEAYGAAEEWSRFTDIRALPAGVEGVAADDVNVRSENGVILIEGAEGATVEVFNASGVCIFSGVATEIPVPQRGLYVVKVAGRATKLAL